MPARKPLTWNTRLARAETLLILGFVSEMIMQPWIFAWPELHPAWKTVFKMGLIVGLFGPVRVWANGLLDRSIATTRSLAENVLSVPRMAVHALALVALFFFYHLAMHGALPWEPRPAETAAVQEPRPEQSRDP